MTEKSEHIIRQEHFVSGWQSGEEAERTRIIALLSDFHEGLPDEEHTMCVACDIITRINGDSNV
jgi:hypothetical protein